MDVSTKVEKTALEDSKLSAIFLLSKLYILRNILIRQLGYRKAETGLFPKGVFAYGLSLLRTPCKTPESMKRIQTLIRQKNLDTSKVEQYTLYALIFIMAFSAANQLSLIL